MTDEKHTLREAARALGFVWCGVTSADTLEDYPTYENWLANGRHGDMEYLNTERARRARFDPRQLVPQAHAIVVLAAIYPAPVDISRTPQSGGVAAYALGDDYHEEISARLWQLGRVINEIAGRSLQQRVYTDSGPLLERALAVRAGLGWIGKNSMVIHPQYGSHFFLGEIITEFPLESDSPYQKEGCGTCDRCIKACPAECILPDRTIDASRCISYLTIEHRGAIPREARKRMGRWIFGCDICQSVCPWNRQAETLVDRSFQPRLHFPIMDLAGELMLEEEEYGNRFRRSPIRRTRREGYQRNIIVAIGNARLMEAIPILDRFLHHPNPVLRGQAAWALGQMPTEESQKEMRHALHNEPDGMVQEEIQCALENY
jgi:epoxyqueuosine reductase